VGLIRVSRLPGNPRRVRNHKNKGGAVQQFLLFLADTLIIVAGMAWAYVAGRESIIWALNEHASRGFAVISYVGMAFECIFIWLGYVGRVRTTVVLASLSLIAALGLLFVESHIYR